MDFEEGGWKQIVKYSHVLLCGISTRVADMETYVQYTKLHPSAGSFKEMTGTLTGG